MRSRRTAHIYLDDAFFDFNSSRTKGGWKAFRVFRRQRCRFLGREGTLGSVKAFLFAMRDLLPSPEAYLMTWGLMADLFKRSFSPPGEVFRHIARDFSWKNRCPLF